MYCDYHTHSIFSDDSETPMRDMMDQAVRLGLKEIAITDHFDPGYPDPDYPFELDFAPYQAALDKIVPEYADRIRIAKGIEIGIMHDQLDRCHQAATSYDYDYIIGSFHCAEGKELHSMKYFEGKTTKQAFQDFYTYVYENLNNYSEYCCLGHLNLVARYASEDADFKDYGDIVEAIFKLIIPQGKGIEINTSSFKYKMRTTCPSEDILRMYKDMGGEIITMGSDAHTPERIADHFEYASEYLQSLGFRFVSTFSHRKPSFVKL